MSALLHALMDYILEFGFKPTTCTEKLCQWNQGRKKKKNPGPVHKVGYSTKNTKQSFNERIINFNPIPAKMRQDRISPNEINNFLQSTKYVNKGKPNMWQTILKYTHEDYEITPSHLCNIKEQCDQIRSNLIEKQVGNDPVMIRNTVGQSLTAEWSCVRRCHINYSFKVQGRVDSQNPAAGSPVLERPPVVPMQVLLITSTPDMDRKRRAKPL